MPSKIRKRKGNTYALAVSDGYTPEGKQIVRSKTITATSKLDAQRQYNAFEAEIRKGKMAYTQKFKLAEFAEVWLKDHCEKNLAPKTVQSYRNQLKFRIIPALGAKPLTKLTPIDIINFMNDLRSKSKRFDGKKEPVSDKVLASCFYVLSSMLWEMKEAWVFTQWNGKPMNPGTSGHWWYHFLQRHQLPPMPFHGLRHVSATILIAQGVPLKNVSARLGHTDIRTTANIYADALESVDRNAAEKMDQYLKKKS